MRALATAAALLGTILLAACSFSAQQASHGRAAVGGFERIGEYPHDPAAFTQGLIFEDGILVESTGRFPSTLRRVRLADGEVLTRRELPRPMFGEGLTRIGDRLYSVTWTEGRGFVSDADDLSPVGSFRYPGEGWGLTDDETRLILSDGTSTLRFIDPNTFQETGRINVIWQGGPLERLNELEWVDGTILANIWQSDRIARIDPASGRVLAMYDLSALFPDRGDLIPGEDVLNGIAWDAEGRRLFVTGKRWPKLFEIRLTEPPALNR